jgi:hypothetical protein
MPQPFECYSTHLFGLGSFVVLLAEADDDRRRLFIPGRMQVKGDFMGDGASRTFRIPLLGQVEIPIA